MVSADWMRVLTFAIVVAAGVQALPTGTATDEQPKTTEQTTKPKVKRSQESLMFGNQQPSRRFKSENSDAAIDNPPPAEKRTLSNSGLEDESSSKTEAEKEQQQQRQQQKQQEWQQWKEQKELMRQQQLQLEKQGESQPLALPNQVLPIQHDKSFDSLAAYYQDPRYKRESELDPEDFLALLSLYEAERKNQGNWKNYGSDDYEPIDDESNMIGYDDEDPRGTGQWLSSGYPGPLTQQQQQRYDLSSELAGLGRIQAARQNVGGYYEYMPAQSYDGLVQYDQPQYVAATGQMQQPSYAQQQQQQRAYYSPEKRFMVSRKRSQNYDSYGSRNGLVLNSRGYPSYQHRLFY
ncbi:hypothetical protein QAD02_017478 [Eretmocerus hayati]|uniref:Uncharacterized protein n=1 Tax=Eretmocerus hayati TaxID=131215 RepID=A0ACC2PFT7_9HYME|nr:hypothetical protein QAD02_017478 [Eretmocerus hayati]